MTSPSKTPTNGAAGIGDAHCETPVNEALRQLLAEISCMERELALAEQSKTESADQLRRLVGAIDATAAGGDSALKPVEMARLIDSALSLNARLQDHAKSLSSHLVMLKSRARRG